MEAPWTVLTEPPPSHPPLGGRILLEIRDANLLADLVRAGLAGVLMRGSENGGRTGPFSSLPLLSAGLEWGRLPVYLQGAAGVRAAAGARAVGASGVLLDDPILLMPESGLPCPQRRLLETPAGRETRLLEGGLRVLKHPSMGREVGWGSGCAWPVGQGIALAPMLRQRYGSVGRLVKAVQEDTLDLCARAARLGEGSPLAASHGTLHPLVQGPMTRVSDTPAFARAVADAGALPMLALALMGPEDARRLLERTRAELGDRPWGVGILGFVPTEVRQAQMEQILCVRPPFALIAGGRPDQVGELERHGIPTYLHCPAPALLPGFVRQGCRRFVFEGRECGGHAGPLGSLTLWEQMVEALLECGEGRWEDYHVLFAGGLGDRRAAAVAATIGGELAERGVRLGLLAGTAYLFTREAVTTGAIVPEYQRQALECHVTVGLESAPGQTNRCARTPFAERFECERRRLTAEGKSVSDIHQELEGLGLGRLRVAAKGLEREGDRLVPVPPERQTAEGMYLLGEVGALRQETLGLEELHGLLDPEPLLAPWRTEPADPAPRPQPCQVAIVGMACALPGSRDLDEFWNLVRSARTALREIPPDRWDWRLYFDPDRHARDKTYSRWGGFLEDLAVDPVDFGLPPNSMPNVNVGQLLALELARRALQDAKAVDRESCAVIVASGDTGGLLGNLLSARTVLPLVAARPEPGQLQRLPSVNEETFVGTIDNITAGRVANRLDLGGPNFTVDAACASSLVALEAGLHELASGRSNAALVGAVDVGQTPGHYLSFSKLTALSPTGSSRPFDREADGIVLSEGAVFLVLKRLADAERDGDRVYAVLQAVGASSDGKALGMTAPLPAGQLRALRRAYRQAGASPASLGYYEAHSTGTPVGDRAEAETVTGLLAEHGAAPRSVAVGSVKALIGHTKYVAGLASLAKAALALHHRTLPPHPVEAPLDALASADSPLLIHGQPTPWFSTTPGRIGVSAFGFGGTNTHAVVEAHATGGAPGGEDWPWELLAFTGSDRRDLSDRLDRLGDLLAREARPRLRDLAWSLALKADPSHPCAAFLVVDGHGTLEPCLRQLLVHLRGQGPCPPEGLVADPIPDEPVAFLFPGQGSQAVGMGREACLYLPELREALELAQELLGPAYPFPLTEALYPGRPFSPQEEQNQRRRVTHTHVAQPLIGALSLGFLRFMERLGVSPAAVGGHSFGELTALAAAGVLTEEDFLRLAEARGRAMAGCEEGAMAAVLASRERVEALLQNGVVVANHNAPEQTVVSGTVAAVERTVERMREAGLVAHRLNVSGAFHSPLMASARGPLAEFITRLNLSAPRVPVYSNGTGQRYPVEPERIRARLQEHLMDRVEFVRQVESMPARVFLEVGPGSLLGRLVEKIRPEATAISPGEGDLRSLLMGLARLGTLTRVDWPALFEGRAVTALDLDRLPVETLSPTAWLVNGTQARRPGDPPGVFGTAPLLDSARAAEEAAEAGECTGAAAPEPRRAGRSEGLGFTSAGAAVAAARSREPAPAPDRLAAFHAYQETMRQFLQSQEQVMRSLFGSGGAAPTGAAIPPPVVSRAVGWNPVVTGAKVRPIAASPAADPAPVRPPAPTAPAKDVDLSAEALLSRLVELVSERTGYPATMLGPDLDIEAQLGIDSIKRLEILDRFVRALPDPGPLDGQLDRLSRCKTLRALASAVSEKVRPAVQPCPRYVVQAEELPRPTGESFPTGVCWLTEDARGVAAQLVPLLKEKGMRPLVLPAAVCSDPERMEERLLDLSQEHGPPAVLLHLAAVGAPEDPQRELRSLFQVTRRFPGLERILTACSVDGHFGRLRPASPYGPACQALLKCLLAEWPGLQARALDLAPELDAGAMADLVLEELGTPGEPVEVGYTPSGRLGFRAVEVPPAGADSGDLPDGAVVLATGGARGITFECLSGLLRAGMRLVLLGTTAPAEESDPSAGVPDGDLRAWLLAGAEGRTPAQLESERQRILRQREVARHLEALRQRGLEVDYRVCDVRDAAGFSALIDGIYARYGRLDAVLHGAGVIRDRLVVDKTMEGFDEVFSTKVTAARVLWDRLRPEGLRLVVLFASTAGRFGNRGQGDYALANEVLTRMAWGMRQRWPSTRVVSVCWGPWAAGMAGEAVNRAFRERGIEPIEVAAGVAFLQQELRRGIDVEVVAGRGPWDQPTRVLAGSPAG
ncbi:MAG: SDR family NAD(P)-dependent oxidoreductase [Candidatus Eremiobacterota bacterium]